MCPWVVGGRSVKGRPVLPLDPIIFRDQAGFNSRLVFEAVRPFEWKEKFSPVVERDQEVKRRVRSKWKNLFP